MFYGIITFVISLITLSAIFFVVSPFDNSGQINPYLAFLISVNFGVLVGSFFMLMLFFVYWLLRAYDDIEKKAFYRRSITFGAYIFVITLLQIYSVLDIPIAIALFVAYICFEIIYLYLLHWKSKS